MTSANKLPEKLSDLLQVALEDLRKAEASGQYRIDMLAWHSPLGEMCHVCLAGAVMAFSLGADITEALVPEDYNAHTGGQFLALNSLRRGDVDSAVRHLSIVDHDCSHLDRDVSAYSDDPKQWHADMEKLVKDLKEAGL